MRAAKFASRYLKSDLFKGQAPEVVTITSAELEEVGAPPNQEEKLVLYFREHDQGLPLNKENINRLIEIFGTDETEEWKGRQVELYYDPNIRFQNKLVGGLRLRAAAN